MDKDLVSIEEDFLPKSDPFDIESIDKDLEEAGLIEKKARAEPKAEQEEEPKPQVKPEDDPAQLRAALHNLHQQSLKIAEERDQWAAHAKKRDADANKLAQDVQVGQYDMIVNHKAGLERELASIKKDLSLAHSQADSDKLADLTEKMADIKAKWLEADAGEQSYRQAAAETEQRQQQQRQQQTRQPQPQPQQRQQPDPAAQWYSSLSTMQQQWVKEHPEVAKDPALLRKADAAARHAVEVKGHRVDSPQYFSAIDEAMGYGKPKPQRASNYSAPVSRTVGADGKSYLQAKLSASQKWAAEQMGMSEKDYLKGIVYAEKKKTGAV